MGCTSAEVCTAVLPNTVYLMFRNLQAEVEQTVADRIDTLGGNDVVSLFQSSQSLIGKFHDLSSIACGSRTVYLHSVDIEYGIIIIENSR